MVQTPDERVWAGRLALVGAAVGVLAVIAYYVSYRSYVNPIAGVAVYALIGFGIGAAIDWLKRRT